MTGEAVVRFLAGLEMPRGLPDGVEVMHPYRDPNVVDLVARFYQKFLADDGDRTGLFGINPGRHGAGLTGIPFTDPKRLQDPCGIDNDLRAHEPSSEFVYMVIDRMGGPSDFYRRFFISSLCPLGFTVDGRNLNYYDRKDLQAAIAPYINSTLREQLDLGVFRNTGIILGMGKNKAAFARLNRAHRFFRRVEALPHPRYIIQYKRKEVDRYIDLWVRTLEKVDRRNRKGT